MAIYVFFSPRLYHFPGKDPGHPFPLQQPGDNSAAREAGESPALMPGISSWETGLRAEESEHRAAPRLPCHVKSPSAERRCGAQGAEGRGRPGILLFSIWGHCLSPSLCTASPLPTVLTSNVGFPFLLKPSERTAG